MTNSKLNCIGKDCLICEHLKEQKLSDKKKTKHPFLKHFRTVVSSFKDLINK